MAYETWVGPTYVSGLAGEAGLSVGLLSLLVAAPWLGSIGQLVGYWAYSRVPSLKRYTVGLAAAARSLWILPLFLAIFWTWNLGRLHLLGNTTSEFPKREWFKFLLAVTAVSALLATSSAAAWSSWMRALVPEGFRGRFFGVRHRFVVIALISANALATLVVGWRPSGLFAGFAVMGGFAVVSASLSTFLLSRVPDAALNTRPTVLDISVFLEPFKNPRFRRVIFFAAAFGGAIQLGGPYFPYYFTHTLKFSMGRVAFWSMLSNVGAFISAGFWGRKIDTTKSARSVLIVAAAMYAFSPLPYLMPAWILKFVGPVEYFFNGFAFSAYTIGIATLGMAAVPDESATVYFSVFAAAIGITNLCSNFMGGQLAQWLIPWGGFRALWVVTSFARAVVAVIFLRRLS